MTHQRKITIEQEKQIVEMYNAGQFTTEIATHFNVNVATIRMALARAKVKTRFGKNRAVVSETTMKQMVSWYNSGQTQRAIGAKLGISLPVISRLLELAGVKKRRGVFGADHGNWKGGEINYNGYRAVRLLPTNLYYCMCNRSGYVAKHRLVMARKLKRPLLKTETVHHIDGDHMNNRINNLQLRQGNHGRGIVLQCLDCGSHNVGPTKIPETKNP